MITILGAGLGGLMLARILYLNQIPAQIFEADASPETRHQGGMLDIHEESGQAALRAAELYDAFRVQVLPGGDALRILDKLGAVHLEDDGNDTRPEIDRGALRNLLLASLPSGMVQWGYRVLEVLPVNSDGYEIHFQNSTTISADTIIGADGAWSKVRPLLSDARPIYSGLSFVETRLFDAEERFPAQTEIVGGGLLFALAEGKGIIAHREPNQELCAYAAFPAPEDWARGEVVLSEVLEQFAGWSPALCGLIAYSESALISRPIYALPIEHTWERVRGITLLGDAAHLMSPFAGEGANLAMQDGAELGLALAANPTDTEAAFRAYEAALFPRSAAAARQSAEGLAMCFNPEAPRPLVEFFENIAALASVT